MKKILCILWIAAVFAGCDLVKQNNNSKLQLANFYASQSQRYTTKAIKLYQELIGKDLEPSLKEETRIKLADLYLSTGRYEDAVQCLGKSISQKAQKKLAIAYFENSQFSDALAQFDRLGKLDDSEYLYYYGQTLEKHNLYDKALDIYSLIGKSSGNYSRTKERINSINLSEGAELSKDIEGIVKNSPTQEDYPEAGAIVLLADEEFEAFADNTAKYDVHMMVKIFNERGKEAFSEIQLGYDSTFEELKLDFARTIKPDGTVAYAGDKNIRDVSIYLNYPLYSNARAKIISMPEITEGAIVEYKATVFHKQLVNEKDFIMNYVVQENEPVKLAKFKVTIPEGRNLNYKIINSEYNKFSADLNPKVENVGNKKVFSWQMENIPEVIPEPDMPPTSRSNPIVLISTFNNWDEIYQWWYNLYKEKINVDSDIQDKINELIKNKNSEEEKLRSIYNFCAQEIRYVAVEYGQAGYEPHEAAEIFKNKYGDCKDQAILLVSMLRAVGFKAYPVLIGTYDSLDLNKDFPSIAFDHCIAVVDFQGQWIFMDPTGETVTFGDLPAMDQDRMVFVVLDDGYKIIPTPIFPAEKNSSHIKMDIKINPDESIYSKRNVRTSGIAQQGQRYWLKFTKPKLIEETLKGTASNIATGARLINYKIENAGDLDKDIVLEYEFQAPEFLTKVGKSRLIPQLGGIDTSSMVKEERVYPLEYPVGTETTTDIAISIPSSFIVKYLPQDVKVDSSWFDFENTYIKNENTVYFHEITKLKKRFISQAEYKEYKQLTEDIARKTNQNIMLEEK